MEDFLSKGIYVDKEYGVIIQQPLLCKVVWRDAFGSPGLGLQVPGWR